MERYEIYIPITIVAADAIHFIASTFLAGTEFMPLSLAFILIEMNRVDYQGNCATYFKMRLNEPVDLRLIHDLL